MEPEGLFPSSEQPLNGSYPELDMSTVQLSTLFFYNNSNIIFPSTPSSSECTFPSGFQIKVLYAFLISPARVKCCFRLILVKLIVPTLFGEACKL